MAEEQNEQKREQEIERRRDEALKRALKMLPKQHRPEKKVGQKKPLE